MTWQVDNRVKVLFVCIGNMCRSPMAEGFARAWGDGRVDAYSAGTSPSGHVSNDSIETMQELGIDISGQSSKGIDAVPIDEIDVVVNMSRLPASTFLPKTYRGRVIEWSVADPLGSPLPEYRRTRDRIAGLVRALLDDLSGGTRP